MHRDIAIEEALALTKASFVDVRSPEEYEHDTIPGAVNVPLFDNEERHRIGVVYAEHGPQEARKLGLSLIAPKLPQMVNRLWELKHGRQMVIFCWRGGDRSHAVAHLLDIMHIPCYRLIGGYKAYRRYVNKHLREKSLPHQFVVLHGLTGTGKTEIIRELGRRGYPVLDLEGLANHRGSVFGSVGLGQQPSQKKFESMILHQIRNYGPGRLLIVEGESKKIGKLFVPEAVYEGILHGHRVLVKDTMENRVRRLIREYVENCRWDIAEVEQALKRLTPRLGKDKVNQMLNYLAQGKLEVVGEILISDYYDVLYRKSVTDPAGCDLVLDASNMERAVQQLEEYINHLM
ncbi:MAG TPA: tRNA 2-selenouridine(34) synthase MnmH [Clostridia bacterium]|nr:tRNA 2-selenouridine(34) synthase MnmH [Clostridia bacterium]